MKKTWWYLIVVILAIFSFFVDRLVSNLVISNRNPHLIGFFEFITHFGDWFILFIFIGIFLFMRMDKRWVLYSWLSLGLTVLVVYLLKLVFARERPLDLGVSFSFPSGHSAAVFSLMPLFIKKFKDYKFLIILIAALVGFSRIYLGYHYLSDVLWGGLIGYFIGEVVSKNESRN